MVIKDKNVIFRHFDFDIIREHVDMIMNRRDCTDVLFNLAVNNTLEQFKIKFWKRYIGKKQEKVIEFFVPKTWKDHFKKTYRKNKLMKWWIFRHPIRNKKLSFKIEKITVFPQVEVPNKREYLEKFTYLEVVKE